MHIAALFYSIILKITKYWQVLHKEGTVQVSQYLLTLSQLLLYFLLAGPLTPKSKL
jgi:hypothetical protein